MSADNYTPSGQPVNYQNQCPHCDVITVIPADKPFEFEDDYCGSCGEHFYSSPVDDEDDMSTPEQSARLDRERKALQVATSLLEPLEAAERERMAVSVAEFLLEHLDDEHLDRLNI